MLSFYFLIFLFIAFHLPTVVPDYDGLPGHDEDLRPSGSQTPPTPPVPAGSSDLHPPSTRPMRQRAMAQLRPVSIPEIVRDMAGSNPVGRIRSTS